MNLKKLVTFALFIIPLISAAQLPDASFTINSATLCEGDSVEFSNTSTNYTNLHWFFGDGSDTWSRQIPKHKYSHDGTYIVKLVALSALGKDSIEKQVVIAAKPNVQIAVSPSDVINLGEKATLSVSNGFTDYLWSTNETTAFIDVFKEGKYWVRIYDAKNCSNSDTVFIAVIQNDMSISSNILTPNVDGYNDFFEIKDIASYNFPIQVFIYNIRNELIYESSDYQNDWTGEEYPSGAYFYLLKTEDRRNKTGTINILK